MECVYCGNTIVDKPEILDPALCWDCTCARVVLSEMPALTSKSRKLRKTYVGLLEESAQFATRHLLDEDRWRIKH